MHKLIVTSQHAGYCVITREDQNSAENTQPTGAHFMHWLAVEIAVTVLETVLLAGGVG